MLHIASKTHLQKINIKGKFCRISKTQVEKKYDGYHQTKKHNSAVGTIRIHISKCGCDIHPMCSMTTLASEKTLPTVIILSMGGFLVPEF